MMVVSVNRTDSNRRTMRRPAGNTSSANRFAMMVPATIATSRPANAHTADEAQAFAERAVAHVYDVGREHAFADCSHPDGGFVNGELYIFCVDVTGVLVASGGGPKLIGHNLADAREPDGRLPVVAVIRPGLSQGSRWVEFPRPNPVTRCVELKDMYVLKVDDHTVCGSGLYEGPPP
jgi:cytochrome c